MSADDEDPQPLGVVGERFMLVERLEVDEHREIWLGHDDHAGRQVVVKRLLGTDAEARARFDRRARQLEALSDPGMASVLEHEATDDPPWLVTVYVEGETTAAIVADRGLSADDALAVIGQTGLALAAAHGAGVGHGRLDAEHIQVRPDGSIALIGFVVDQAPSPAADLAGLARLSHQLLGDATDGNADIAGFVRLLDAGDWDDPADIGRTALALAAAQRVGAALPMAVAAETKTEPEDARPRPWYTEEERKRVRNRLIALAVIVVLGGAILMRIFTAGAGHTAVPNVVHLPFVTAQQELNQVGLRADETITTGPLGSQGTVIAQDPAPGQQAKVGSVVQLTVAATGSG